MEAALIQNKLLPLEHTDSTLYAIQALKNPLVRSYLQVPQAAGQVKLWMISNEINIFSIYTNNFCDAGQVPILRYFKA